MLCCRNIFSGNDTVKTSGRRTSSDGRDAVRPVWPEPASPPLIHSSDHRDPPARLLLPFTRCPRVPRSLRHCALALPCLPSPRAPPSRRHFLALSDEATSLSFDSPTPWLPSKLTTAVVSSAFHSSGSMGARPPPSVWAYYPLPDTRTRKTHTRTRKTQTRSTRSLVRIVNVITRIYFG
jgi:hypothetical protein